MNTDARVAATAAIKAAVERYLAVMARLSEAETWSASEGDRAIADLVAAHYVFKVACGAATR